MSLPVLRLAREGRLPTTSRKTFRILKGRYSRERGYGGQCDGSDAFRKLQGVFHATYVKHGRDEVGGLSAHHGDKE
jgi:hypothetical protein